MTSMADWGTANGAATASRSLETTASRPVFLADIERAKGLAIILVVIGHVVAREPPANNEWYVVLKSAIYAFHMPFFMYLGGLVFFHVGDAVNPRPSYRAYLIRRAERLLVPFLLLGLLILLGKFAAEQFLHVDNKPASLSDGLKSLFWTTGQSPATSVWYIFVVFIYCAITPLLVRLSHARLWPILINELAPDYLWVALGVPYEQAFVAEFTPRLTKVGIIKTSGGLFNFLSGSRQRAPRWMQDAGLEWVWRIWLEPRRLFWRYLTTNPRALYLLLNRSRGSKPDHAPLS
jgi:hypothetical protein